MSNWTKFVSRRSVAVWIRLQQFHVTQPTFMLLIFFQISQIFIFFKLKIPYLPSEQLPFMFQSIAT